MSKLAINGGTPIRTDLFPAYKTISEEEKKAVNEVLDSGNLSQFIGAWCDDFNGGPKIREFEEKWANRFGARFAITVNSNTSGLYAAIGACGIGPGDEVIVSPYSMSASAICAMVYGAVPVFADIQSDIFNVNPKSIEERINNNTKAIVVVHIFGHTADMDPIMEIARKHRLYVIEDCAQAPLATYHGKIVGTIGDIGVFSLNYHKHIHTGEGGVITTNNEDLALRLKLIRNHGETSVFDARISDLSNMWGFNYRLTEIQAAIGIVQLQKMEKLIQERIDNCNYIARKLRGYPGMYEPVVYANCRHVYYVHAYRFKEEEVGISRDAFVSAVAAELPSAYLRETTGKLISSGYVEPIYLQPIYQKKSGTRCSFNCPRYTNGVNYSKGICPVTENMYEKELFTHEYMRPPMTTRDLDDFINAVDKVYSNKEELIS